MTEPKTDTLPVPGAVDIFASSGGAVNALALAAMTGSLAASTAAWGRRGGG